MSQTDPNAPGCFEASALQALARLRAAYPTTPFLTLGQTVLWDEPVKAAFCRILEVAAPEATMMAAVHDTDYFAKLGHLAPDEVTPGEKFALLGHNDGSTRGLWSAAGELSCLFGSEDVPTRHALTRHGVAFDRVARHYPGGATALLDEQTGAWGWRALVHAEPNPLIAADVKLADIAPALRRQLLWGFTQSTQLLRFDDAVAARQSAAIAAQVQGWIDEYIEFDEEGTLGDLYRALTPRLWSLVRGGGSCNLQSSTSTQLFRFNSSTCGLPRFAFVDLFLNPATRQLARDCYDEAVRGSGIYQLAQFGEGALPFDAVIRGRGRGTVRLHEGTLTIETEEPIVICNGCDPGSAADLAAALETTFGDGVALVGKAVALISMLAAEFIFVFHEGASSYTARTQAMNKCMRAHGLGLPLHPMLRLQYHTWDALAGVTTRLVLPPHLASAFGAAELPATQFAQQWQGACDRASALLDSLKQHAAPRELLQFLAQHEATPGTSANGPTPAGWAARLHDYDAARAVIAGVRQASAGLAQAAQAARTEAAAAAAAAQEAQRAKGRDWRATVQPLRRQLFDIREAAAARVATTAKLSKDERRALASQAAAEDEEVAALRRQIDDAIAVRAPFDAAFAQHHAAAAEARRRARAHTAERVATERSEAARAARATISRIEYEAELQRLLLARDAIIAGESLRHTNHRPTAWWFPLVSPDGLWFNNLVRSTQARIEEL